MRTLFTRALTVTAGVVAILTATAGAANAALPTSTIVADSVEGNGSQVLTAQGVGGGVDHYGYTVNINSSMVMAVLGASTANNAAIIQYPMSKAHPDNDYMWFEYQGGTANWYRIKPATAWTSNIRTDKCLVVQGASTANNAAVIQYTCTYDDGVNNDVWAAVQVYSGSTWLGDEFKNVKSGKCLVVAGASMTKGVHLIQYDCGSGAPYNELWKVGQVDF